MSKLTEGRVDIKKEYFELTYGLVQVEKPTFVKVALLGKTNDQEFVYQFLPDVADSTRKEIIDDLNFYLVEKEEKDPWLYAKYHATTSSNVYSHVHWNFYPVGTIVS